MAGWSGLSDGCKLTFSMWVPPDQLNQSRSPSITSRGHSGVFPPGFSACQTPGPAGCHGESANVSSKVLRSSRSDCPALAMCRPSRLNSSSIMSKPDGAVINPW